MTVQEDWRWCKKCQGLFFGASSQGVCPAGGAHSNQPSGNYVLIDSNLIAQGQPDWHWCSKCQGLFFAKGPQGVCPAGGAHDGSGSGEYKLMHYRDS
jgi:hypothetical protein